MRMFWRQIGATLSSMPSIQIKNVPDEVHRTLRARAAANGQSLQEYLLGRLIAEAEQEPLNAWLDRIEQHSGGSLSFDFAVDAIRRERDSR
jgi:plasmid stability protein